MAINRAVNFIKKWIEMCFYDFEQGTPMREQIELFIRSMRESNNSTELKCAELLADTLVSKICNDPLTRFNKKYFCGFEEMSKRDNV